MHTSIGPALTRPPFTDQEFSSTRFDTAADKAVFANALCRFIAADFRESLWTQKLYYRLSMSFGMIAHYDSRGFWSAFFTNPAGKVAFLEELLNHPCYGQPDYTYCDVERAIQDRLHAGGTLASYRALAESTAERAERAVLARLRSKYDGVSVSPPVYVPAPRPVAAPTGRRADHRSDQTSLF